MPFSLPAFRRRQPCSHYYDQPDISGLLFQLLRLMHPTPALDDGSEDEDLEAWVIGWDVRTVVILQHLALVGKCQNSKLRLAVEEFIC